MNDLSRVPLASLQTPRCLLGADARQPPRAHGHREASSRAAAPRSRTSPVPACHTASPTAATGKERKESEGENCFLNHQWFVERTL